MEKSRKQGRTVVVRTASFRELRVWRKSVELVEKVYKVTGQMPTVERFGLTSQIRRAAVSIPSNIAEGNARQTRKDYIHFLTVARGSLAELETQLIIAQELRMIAEAEDILEEIGEITRMLQALINSLQQSPQP